jgi:hypothetical protein
MSAGILSRVAGVVMFECAAEQVVIIPEQGLSPILFT